MFLSYFFYFFGDIFFTFNNCELLIIQEILVININYEYHIISSVIYYNAIIKFLYFLDMNLLYRLKYTRMTLEPPKYEYLNKENTKKMLKIFKGERTGWVLVGEKKWFFPHKYTIEGKGFYNFKARPDDIWVLSYPRSGKLYVFKICFIVIL